MTVNDLKWCVLRSLVGRSVVTKLNLWENQIPLFDVFPSKASKYVPQTTFNHFCLAIYLWMCCQTELKSSVYLAP